MNDVGGVVSEVFRDLLMSLVHCRVSGSTLESIVTVAGILHFSGVISHQL